MMSLRTFTRLPSIQNGFELDDQFSVVVPIARTNLVTNPSFEVATTGWTALGGSIARSTLFQYHGAYSLAITPTATTTDGARFDTVSLTSGTTYAYSAKVLGIAGVAYKLCLETTGGVELTSVAFVASGRWQWIVGYYAETSTTTRRVTLRKNGSASTAVFYLDGAQVEAIVAGEIASTYLDGDQLGYVPNQNPPAYLWNGTPHASTSTRSGLTRAGGMVVKFKDFGFFLTAIIGLGLALPSNVATEYARLDGGYDAFTRKPTRQFTLSGQFQGGLDYLQLRQYRGGLSRLLDRDLIGQDQRLLLRREVIDPCGVVRTGVCQIVAKYQGGMEGNTDNQTAEQAAITFTQYFPVVLSDGEAGNALGVQTSISNGLRILQRSAAGVWGPLNVGANNNVWSLLYASDGKLYAGGEFTSIGGVAANRIAYWDGAAWNAMGSGGNAGAVLTIAEGPDGSIYAGGDPTAFGGVANTNFIAKWNGSAWSSVTGASVANAAVQKIVFGPDGMLYAGGAFSSIGGVAANRIAKWNGTIWAVMGAGSLSSVNAIVVAPNGRIYIGGDTNSDGVIEVAYWTGAAWVIAGAVAPAELVESLGVGPNGIIYVGGTFTTIGGVAAARIAQYNGVAFTPLGTGITTGTEVVQIVPRPDGTLLVSGVFTGVGGITTVHNIARWNGSAWVYLDVDIAWSALRAIAQKSDGTLAIGGSGATSTGVAGANTTITNIGTAKSYPIITVKGPTTGTSRIYQITNYTTGRNIYLNLTTSAGETVTLVFQPDALSFTSSFQGNIASTILSGSNVADFSLQPGVNAISFFSADSTVVATLRYRPAYLSLDDVP